MGLKRSTLRVRPDVRHERYAVPGGKHGVRGRVPSGREWTPGGKHPPLERERGELYTLYQNDGVTLWLDHPRELEL